MTKTFRELLAEKDDEFTYYIRSTVDIHHPDLFERIRLSLLPYQIKAFETDGYRPLGKNNTYFPDQPFAATWTLKVITGLPITRGFLATMAMDAHIHISHLRIDGDDLKDLNAEDEFSSTDAQDMVGQKRIGAFIRELEKDRKGREKMTIEREVYESFYTTHRGLQDVVKKPVPNGYYLVETYLEEGKKFFTANGPFESRPEGDYHDRMRASGVSIINENNIGESYGVHVQVDTVEVK